MTIDELNALTTLTATDEVPVWDSEESSEPTKKITASNLAASVKSLAGLPNTTEMNAAIAQSTAKTMDVTVNMRDLSFEKRDAWYRANKSISSIFNRDDISFVQTTSWTGTNMPIITQIDGNNVQFISPAIPPNTGYVSVRGLIL